MIKPCVFLKALPGQEITPWQDPWLSERVEILDQYDLSPAALHERSSVILTMHQDQRWLASQQDLLDSFVREGGTLIVQGQIAIPFLDILNPFVPINQPRLADFPIDYRQPHPIFHGIDPQTLNKRHGVAGFYARGFNPPPEHASIITTMSSGTVAVDWIAQHGAGRVFNHPGNDLWTTFADREANLALTQRLVHWSLSQTGAAR